MGMPKTVEEVQAHFSKELTAEEISLIEENMTHYAFMNDRESQRYAWCSCCHQHVDLLIKHKHNEEWSCPKCGALIKIKHICSLLTCKNDGLHPRPCPTAESGYSQAARRVQLGCVHLDFMQSCCIEIPLKSRRII